MTSINFQTLLNSFLDFFGFHKPEINETCKPPLAKVERTGIITERRDDYGMINKEIIFTMKMEYYALNVGDYVSYTYRVEDGIGENVKFLSSGCESRSHLKNSVIGTVSKREGRIFFVIPGNYKFDLDQVHIEFLPYRGDWVQLIFKDEDEDIFNYNVEKVFPLRTKFFTGSVTQFKNDFGIINRHIYFTIYNCNPGYKPHPNDKVICSAIESNQGYCDWRAVMVTDINHESVSKKYEKPILYTSGANETFESEDIVVTCCNFITLYLGEEKMLNASIKNNSSNQKLVNISVHPEGIIIPETNQAVLESGSVTEFIFKVVASHIGFSAFRLSWHFENCIINKTVHIEVILNCNLDWNCKVPTSPNEKDFFQTGNLMSLNDKIVLPGDRNFKPYSFLPVVLERYSVPEDLIKLYSEIKNKNVLDQMLSLQKMLPCLALVLDRKNYKVKLHTLLFLEEIAILDKVAKLQVEVSFQKLNGFLLAKLPENEDLHLLGQGDKVFADLPWGADSEKDVVYEGYIKTINDLQIIIGFHEDFTRHYVEGRFYRLQFQTSRTSYRRKHQAVDLCEKTLGYDWLFPTNLCLKKPQVIINGEEEKNLNHDLHKYTSSPYQTEIKVRKWNHSFKYKRQRNTGPNVDISINVIINWFNAALNKEQKQCIRTILEGVARPLPYIIFGPPGTGKTFTITELVIQIVLLIPGSRLLITAPSNSAVDVIALSLINTGMKKSELIRLLSHRYANQGRLPVSLVDISAMPTYDSTLDEHVNANGIKYLSKDIIGRHKVTLGTLNLVGMLHNMGFPKGHFTHIIIDEAGQTTEPETLIPVGFLNKNSGQLILAGDPIQLGPVVMSEIASKYGLDESYLKRIFSSFPYSQDPEHFHETCGFDPRLVTKLRLNYRSLPAIVSLYSKLFYNNELISQVSDSESPEWKILKSAEDIFITKENTLYPIKFHGISGVEDKEFRSPSYFNKYEVMEVITYIRRLYKLGIEPEHIGVVTPYKAQVKKICQLCLEFLMEIPKIGSVEEFQGQERNFIIISTVRSTRELSSLRFISNPYRFNVSVSRAKIGLIVIGDPNALLLIKEWHYLISLCVDNKCYVGCEIPEGFL